MADRTSASVFGIVFSLLAENPTDEHKEMAKRIFNKTKYYDFSPDQMDVDEHLLKLGLAKMGIDLDYPEDGEVILYPDFDEFIY